MKEECKSCGKALTPDERAVTRKLINRGAKEFFCVDCLAVHFDVQPREIRERIAYFKAMGCTLFEENQMLPERRNEAGA